MANHTQYSGSRSDTSGKPSGFWADCRWNDMAAGHHRGCLFFEDFNAGGMIVSPTTEAVLGNLPMTGYNSDSVSGTYPALTAGIGYDHVANSGGALRLANTTDNNGSGIRGVATPWQISANKGTLWFETRLKISTVATLEMSFFAGLCETTYSSTAVVAMSATVPLVASTGLMGDFNLVGFHKPEGNTTVFDTSYKANGVTLVEVNSDVGALAADTYVKLGMKFEPRRGNVLTFFINGVKQANTKTIPDNTGTDFPADAALGWIIAMGMGAGGGDNSLSVDWIRIAQEIGT